MKQYESGHTLGLPEQDEELVLRIAKTVGCIVASPDYRLAPENPYPADIDDCYEALTWFTENFPVRKDKIAIAGQSAGGGLVAALAQRLRDFGGSAVCFQMPLYPMLDCRNNTVSLNQITDKRVWNKEFTITAWAMYLDGLNGNIPAYAFPALAEDLSGLLPAYIMVGQLDPFRDETITYAQKLLQAGVPVELHIVSGGFHGFENAMKDTPIAKRISGEYN